MPWEYKEKQLALLSLKKQGTWDIIQMYEVCCREKSIFCVHDEQENKQQAYFTKKTISVRYWETLSNVKNSKALQQADHEVFNIRGFSTNIKQTPSGNDIGTVDPPQGKEMEGMILWGPLQPELSKIAWFTCLLN